MSTLNLLLVFVLLGGGAQAEGKELAGQQNTSGNTKVDALAARLSLIEANEEANRREIFNLKLQLHHVNGDNLHLRQQLRQVKEENLLQTKQLQQVKGQLHDVKGDNLHQTHLLYQYSVRVSNVTERLLSVECELDQYRSKLKQLNTTTRTSERAKRSSSSVGFQAILYLHVALSHQDHFKFDYITYNDGGAYNGRTGVFTAPQNGIYFFITTVRPLHVNNTVDVNPQGDAVMSVKKTDYLVSNTAHVVAHMDAGNTAWVKSFGPLQRYGWSSFSGFLIHPGS